MPADAGIVVINVLICYIFQVGVVRRIRRRGMATEDQKEKAWESAKKIRGEDPDKYRKTPTATGCTRVRTVRTLQWVGK